MNKNFVKWTFSTLSLVCVTFSLILVFYGTAKATCTIIQTCSNGGTVSCSGDACQQSPTSVTCTQNNGHKITQSCPGSDS